MSTSDKQGVPTYGKLIHVSVAPEDVYKESGVSEDNHKHEISVDVLAMTCGENRSTLTETEVNLCSKRIALLGAARTYIW